MQGRENKPHIGIFGRRNFGKSTLFNAMTGQRISIVSPVAGTTTDPVKKSMELFGVGPVVLLDTAGIDDIGGLGEQRIDKAYDVLKIVDFALIVVCDGVWGEPEEKLVAMLKDFGTPFLVVANQMSGNGKEKQHKISYPVVQVNALSGDGVEALWAMIAKQMPRTAYVSDSLLAEIVSEDDTVVLVTPIDSEAPAGRLILPQVQTIRDILDNHAIAVVLQENKLASYLATHAAPRLVITDSQVFNKVSKVVPAEVPLTSFSIVLAHHKGDFAHYVQGTPFIDKLQEGDRILMLESCTHQTSCEDIGRVKIPRLLQQYTKKTLAFDFVAGLEAVPDVAQYAMVVQCGGCMVTRKQLLNRLRPAIEKGIPVTNYGMLLAYLNGIFARAVQVFEKNNQENKKQ